MKEDDENPFAGEKWLGDHRRYDAYRDGQLHPSPQTIKKIQTNFAEKVKEKLRTARRKEKDGQYLREEDMHFNGAITVADVIVDTVLKQQNEGEE